MVSLVKGQKADLTKGIVEIMEEIKENRND